jgi:hypothetical protein
MSNLLGELVQTIKCGGFGLPSRPKPMLPILRPSISAGIVDNWTIGTFTIPDGDELSGR